MENQEEIEIPEEEEEKLLTPQEIIKMNDEQTEELIKSDDLCAGGEKELHDRYDFLRVLGEGGFG
jgi:hypothetical protein